jgi:tetratricopeptide (TPR) repeat protein
MKKFVTFLTFIFLFSVTEIYSQISESAVAVARKNLQALFNNGSSGFRIDKRIKGSNDLKYICSGEVEILEDRIGCKPEYANFIKNEIIYKEGNTVTIGDYFFGKAAYSNNYRQYSKACQMAKEFLDNIKIVRQYYLEIILPGTLDSMLTKFKPLALEYNNLAIKPAIIEEQRKFIVQANALNENKKYDLALEAYNNAININQTSYPAAYYNMALISALSGDYQNAIFNMKKYLMLVPEAEDARAAQDKIYEWEIYIKK